jgi:hypothetical protein
MIKSDLFPGIGIVTFSAFLIGIKILFNKTLMNVGMTTDAALSRSKGPVLIILFVTIRTGRCQMSSFKRETQVVLCNGKPYI